MSKDHAGSSWAGNPLSLDPFQADNRPLFYGKAMLILRATEGRGGKITVSAESEGLKPASVTVQSAAAR